MNTLRSGVFASIQRPACSWARLIVDGRVEEVPDEDEPGEIAETASTPAMAIRGQCRMSHAARIATAIHMIWKYLFMSKSTALTRTTLGITNSATIQATRNRRDARPRAVAAATIASANGQAEVGGVEEQDAKRPLLEARLAPAGHEA